MTKQSWHHLLGVLVKTRPVDVACWLSIPDESKCQSPDRAGCQHRLLKHLIQEGLLDVGSYESLGANPMQDLQDYKKEHHTIGETEVKTLEVWSCRSANF